MLSKGPVTQQGFIAPFVVFLSPRESTELILKIIVEIYAHLSVPKIYYSILAQTQSSRRNRILITTKFYEFKFQQNCWNPFLYCVFKKSTFRKFPFSLRNFINCLHPTFIRRTNERKLRIFTACSVFSNYYNFSVRHTILLVLSLF
jgi:hypothetical protein